MRSRLENAIETLEDYLSYLNEISFDYSDLIFKNKDGTYTMAVRPSLQS